MSIVVVGGHSRNVGKTSVVAGIIAALPQMNWTAAKITQFGHGVCSITADPCECALNETEHSWSIDVEFDRSGDSDTSRFLLAGAAKVLWVRTKQGMLAEAMPALRKEIAAAEIVILESNSVMKFIRPDIYLTVLDYENADFKASALEFLDRADAVLLHAGSAVDTNHAAPAWDNISLKLIAGKPTFLIHPPQYVTPEIVQFVRQRLTVRAVMKPR
jgi:molybdopterin-guanine dinucleotide biosynthesis protein